MKKGIFCIQKNQEIARDVFYMVLEGDTSAITKPGQFINIALDGLYLRRPISVCDWGKGSVSIIYKVVGKGTSHMASLKSGQTLDVLCGLGNGFDVKDAGDAPLLVGGGVGVPPLYGLAKALINQGVTPSAVLGFQTKEDVFYAKEFESLGVKTTITTQDGSFGTLGLVTDVINDGKPSYIYACGPEAMLRAVYEKSLCDGQFSFEERMACGFGACMGCSCKTKSGYKRICKEGPVLRKDEILWQI